jgi:hypothetical protein
MLLGEGWWRCGVFVLSFSLRIEGERLHLTKVKVTISWLYLIEVGEWVVD